MLDIFELIDVFVLFRKNVIQPSYFIWNGRQIKIDKINLIHKSQDGSSVFYHFSVSSKDNFYKLKFDTNKMNWTLEAVDEDDTAY